MLKGDLTATTIADVLRELADGAATGCLHVVDPAGQTAKAYLRGGRVYAVLAPGDRPQLGARLVSSGALGPEALAEALEAQRTELQGWRLGELLVHLGYVDQPVVEAFVDEQVRESLSTVLPWQVGQWKFRVNERTREDVAPPVPVEQLLAEIESRRATWAVLEQTVHGADAVPVLSAAGTADSELEVDADAWSLLCKVDGVRTVTELARECGFTLYEAGRVVFTLVQAGLLEVDDTLDDLEDEPEPVSDLVPADVASRLVSALSGIPAQTDLQHDEFVRSLEQPAAQDDVSGSITRVSEALAALLGPATAGDDVFNTPLHRPKPAPPAAPEDPKRAEKARRDAVRRARDAEELATAQADLEAARAAEQERRDDLLPDGHVADVVDLHAVREAARLEDEAAAAAAADEAAAEQVRAEAEAGRLEQERLAAEAAAEQARLAAEAAVREEERQAAEVAAEHARLEAEAAEAARLEDERLAAEVAEQARQEAEAARLVQEQLAAEAAAEAAAAAAEQARLEAEAAELARVEEESRAAETARLEAEAAAAAEAARRDDERRAAEAAAEQARLDAEAEAVRIEDERLAAEAAEQARVEAEAAEAAEAARIEAERLAAEAAAAEQARREAEAAELARIAQEQHAAAQAAEEARLEAEAAAAEQARQAEQARLEQERLAAEAEAERAAAEATELARRQAEQDEADRLAAAAELERVLQETARAEFAEAALLEDARAEQARLDAAVAKAEAEAAAAEFAAFAADQVADEAPALDREAQAAAFAELSASASLEVPEPQPAMAASVPLESTWDDEPLPSYASHDTDTASLLRELSSLGLDDDPAPAPPTRPRPPAPRPVAAPAKKKKGLFGRG